MPAKQNLYQLSLKVEDLKMRLDAMANDIEGLRQEVAVDRRFVKSMQANAASVEQDVEDTVEGQNRSRANMSRMREDLEGASKERETIRQEIADLAKWQNDAENALRWLLGDYFSRVHRIQVPDKFKEDHPALFLTDGTD